jgi:hypothetical protein
VCGEGAASVRVGASYPSRLPATNRTMGSTQASRPGGMQAKSSSGWRIDASRPLTESGARTCAAPAETRRKVGCREERAQIKREWKGKKRERGRERGSHRRGGDDDREQDRVLSTLLMPVA